MSDVVRDAIARKKLRVYWDAPELDGAPAREALLDGIWAALRQRHAAPQTSQDERVEIQSLTAGPDPDTYRVAFRYTFDRDFASQYDERETFTVELVLDRTGALASIDSWVSQSAS